MNRKPNIHVTLLMYRTWPGLRMAILYFRYQTKLKFPPLNILSYTIKNHRISIISITHASRKTELSSGIENIDAPLIQTIIRETTFTGTSFVVC